MVDCGCCSDGLHLRGAIRITGPRVNVEVLLLWSVEGAAVSQVALLLGAWLEGFLLPDVVIQVR